MFRTLVSSVRVVRPQRRAFPAAARAFSTDDSHDDFKPKAKPRSEDSPIIDAADIIRKQVTDNDIMLYMKVIYTYLFLF
jgi:hypothetical protein